MWFILGMFFGAVLMFMVEEVRFMLRIGRAMRELEADISGTIAALE